MPRIRDLGAIVLRALVMKRRISDEAASGDIIDGYRTHPVRIREMYSYCPSHVHPANGMDIHDITVSVSLMQHPDPFLTTIYRKVIIGNAATEGQREKLLYIAKHCPVARLLEGDLAIDTTIPLADD